MEGTVGGGLTWWGAAVVAAGRGVPAKIAIKRTLNNCSKTEKYDDDF